jgi:hypothetical protein
MLSLYSITLLPDADRVLRVMTFRTHASENVSVLFFGWSYAHAQLNSSQKIVFNITCVSTLMQTPSHIKLSNLRCTFCGHQPKQREQNVASPRKSSCCAEMSGIALMPDRPGDHDVSGCVYAKMTGTFGKSSGTLLASALHCRPICPSGSVRSSHRSSARQSTRKLTSAVTSSWCHFAALSRLSPRSYLASPYTTLMPHPLRPFYSIVRTSIRQEYRLYILPCHSLHPATML